MITLHDNDDDDNDDNDNDDDCDDDDDSDELPLPSLSLEFCTMLCSHIFFFTLTIQNIIRRTTFSTRIFKFNFQRSKQIYSAK